MESAYRLPPDLQADLTWYWCEAESELGVRSSTGAQVARLEVGAGSREAIRKAADAERAAKAPPPSPESGVELVDGVRIRLSLADSRVRGGGSESRRTRREAALRMYMLFGPVHDARAAAVADPFPDGAERARERMVRVHAAIARLGRSADRGPQHQRVLYRVYGPRVPHLPSYGVVGPELAPLVEYAPAWSPAVAAKPAEVVLRAVRRQAGEMLAAASLAYLGAWRDVVTERRETRRARFRAVLGAA